MEREEFAEISGRYGGGNCGVEMWDEIESTYMASNLTKDELAFVYWNHTGIYEQIAAAAKEYAAAAKDVAKGAKDFLSMPTKVVMRRTEALADAARKLSDLEDKAKVLFLEEAVGGKGKGKAFEYNPFAHPTLPEDAQPPKADLLRIAKYLGWSGADDVPTPYLTVLCQVMSGHYPSDSEAWGAVRRALGENHRLVKAFRREFGE